MKKKIRYAVVGLGYISQAAALPAFAHAKENSELTALVSGDSAKLKKLSKKYKIKNLYSYDNFDECLKSGNIDAVYIALPNSMHREYTEKAARAGIHVLCEKPMAVTKDDCQAMIDICRENGVKLMIAYRLHFEKANLEAVKIARSKKLGDIRIFNSTFTMNVEDRDNIRLQKNKGGGTLFDIGIYCINAARYLFQAEPEEFFAMSSKSSDPRFSEVDEMTSAILRFPNDRVATFTCSFGAAPVAEFQLVGTKGNLRMSPAFTYSEGLNFETKIDEKTKKFKFKKSDQFAPEFVYFSECILKNKEPEPSGTEGLEDVNIITALYESVRKGLPVKLNEVEPSKRPTLKQEIRKPAVKEQSMVRAQSPEGESVTS